MLIGQMFKNIFKRKPTFAELHERSKQTEADFRQRVEQAETDEERAALILAFARGDEPFPRQDYRKARRPRKGDKLPCL